MFILSNRNIVLSTQNGGETYAVPRGFIGEVPDHFCWSPYFNALVKDGKIVLSATTKDKDVVRAAEDSEKVLEEAVKRTRKPKQDKE